MDHELHSIPTWRAADGFPRARGRWLVVVISLVVAISACAREAPEEPEHIEPVEIRGGPTSAMTAEEDEVAASSGEESLIGVLPGGIPENLPLPVPASVVDFGTDDDRFVVLRTTLSREAAQSQLARKLDAAGWTAAGDRWTRTRDGDRVVIRFDTGDAGQTLVRIEYGR